MEWASDFPDAHLALNQHLHHSVLTAEPASVCHIPECRLVLGFHHMLVVSDSHSTVEPLGAWISQAMYMGMMGRREFIH